MKKYLAISAVALLAATDMYAPSGDAGGRSSPLPESFGVYAALPIAEGMVTSQSAAKLSTPTEDKVIALEQKVQQLYQQVQELNLLVQQLQQWKQKIADASK